ncbi:hypothetical protein [Natrinema salaciae]|uniref:Uncharacterized protein n=1 Tax=Natrinema salaciae TaxID=1186196 RepID=A0A1H9NNW7_9EURY|nr:hypothetical protein [Natrinema salaciae]SER37581.1 hypothetical protein SAMN04489841_3675 [Natrinema salaciae]
MSTGRRILLCAVALVAILAVGPGTATAAADVDCDSTGSTVVGSVDGEWTDGDETLYEGSTFELAYCTDGTTYTGDWLAAGDGFERDSATADDDGTYTVTLTGNGTASIAFAKSVTLNEDQTDGLSVTVATAGGDTAALERIDDARVAEYRTARSALSNATDELTETTTAIENGDAELDAAESDLEMLTETYENMTDREAALSDYLLRRTESGNASGAYRALTAVGTDATAQRAETEDAIDRYTDVAEAERAGAASSVRLAALGSIAGGLVAGGVAGVAVPLVAARRVEEAMKLSRNVSYDRKTALVPILVGIALAIGGAALLAVVVGPELLEVIR